MGYFSMKKSNQKSLGEDPETPDASEPSRPETLRIPGAGLDDADKEPQAHFMWGSCKPIAGSHAVEPMG